MITWGCNLQAFVLSQTRCVGHLPLAPKPRNSTNAPQIYEMISVYHVEIAHINVSDWLTRIEALQPCQECTPYKNRS